MPRCAAGECEPGNDPRYRRVCVRCGHLLETSEPIQDEAADTSRDTLRTRENTVPTVPTVPTETVSDGPPMRLRNLEHERDFIEHAARGVVNPELLIEFCQMRASTLSGEYVPDPMLVRLDVDQPLEVREELADGINRLVWWLEDHLEFEGLRDRRMAALRHLVMAYDLISRTG